jgi:mRNA-degrading endonuclease RelE of RelBE toxin-antitoxin system
VNITVRITRNFKKDAKPLFKKYPSFPKDLQHLEEELTENPWLGTQLGHGAYKIRLKIASKGKGKSGGARVISLVEVTVIGEITQNKKEVVVNLISIYDKSETASISDKELKELIRLFQTEK